MSVNAESSNTEKEKSHEERMSKIKDEKFKEATTKYLSSILVGIENAARSGLRTKFINFDREDFKANCKGLGFPQEFLMLWLEEMSKSDTSYIEEKDGLKETLEGITMEFVNMRKFTVKFSW